VGEGFIGLLHIAELSHGRAEWVGSVLSVGSKIKVIVLLHTPKPEIQCCQAEIWRGEDKTMKFLWDKWEGHQLPRTARSRRQIVFGLSMTSRLRRQTVFGLSMTSRC